MAHINFRNRTLFHGDNLTFLRGMNSGTVHLIATDPPFNKARDFHATPDSIAKGARFTDRWAWERDTHPEWIDAIQDDWPAVWSVINAAEVASGEDMAAFLCWLGVRLLEMHRVLRDDGSIYLHIDHTAHAYVKALMDGIFGRENFRNEVVWFYDDAPGRSNRYFPRKHDTILWYSKSENWIFNDDAIRVPLKAASVKRYQSPRVIGGKSYIGGESASKGKIPEDVWPMPVVKKNRANKESTGYPTQKPLALYDRIIRASSNVGDIVLDPFAGCATTPVAAERLGRQWIGMDIWDDAHQMVLDRLLSEGLAVEGKCDTLISLGDVHYSTAAPVRSDDAEVAAPVLKLKSKRRKEPPGPRQTRAEMRAILMEENGMMCEGCDRTFDDARYLELDHNTPRSSGGINHISNRLLLCGPCNRVKSDTLTLKGLRQRNRQEGWMFKPGR